MSESRVVSANSASGLIAEVKALMADGWTVKGVSAHDADSGVYSQELIRS